MGNRSRHLELRVVWLVLLGIVMGGCAQPTASPTALPATPAASLTPTLTPSPTSTLTPTATSFIPFPPETTATHALTHAIVDNVFFGGSIPECELPCWHGLVIGYANSNDVKTVFDRVFNFGGLPYLDTHELDSGSAYIDFYHVWRQEIDDKSMSIFSAVAIVDRNTNKLEALWFGVPLPYSSIPYSRFHPDLTVDRIIKNLGQPPYWEMELKSGGQGKGTNITLTSFMLYNNGISFYHIAEFPATRVTDSSSAPLVSAQFCLNDNLTVTANILRPLVNGFTNLSPLEETVYGIRKQLRPLDEVLGIGAEELVKISQTESNPCLTLTVADY